MEFLLDLFARVFNEQQRRIKSCMYARGFEYTAHPYVDSEIVRARLQNPLNEEIALEYGYHLPPLPETALPEISSDAFLRALQGDGATERGCLADESVLSLRDISSPSFDLYAELMFALDNVTDNDFFASEQFSRLSESWAACMASNGYQFDDWFGPIREFSGAGSVTEEELIVRARDLECDREVELTQTRSEIQRQAFDEWRVDSQLQLVELRELVDRAESQLRELESQEL